MLLFGGGAPSTPLTLATMRLRPRLRLRARAKDRSLDRKLLSLKCDPEQYSTLLWPLVTCNHSCIKQEMACYTLGDRRCGITLVAEMYVMYHEKNLIKQALEDSQGSHSSETHSAASGANVRTLRTLATPKLT